MADRVRPEAGSRRSEEGNQVDPHNERRIHRNDKAGPVYIDFEGYGWNGIHIPLEESPFCTIRGERLTKAHYLYFYRINRSRDRWLRRLKDFLDALETEADNDRAPAAGLLDNCGRRAPQRVNWSRL